MHSKLKVCIKLPWSPEEEKLCSIRKGQEKLYRKFEIRSFEGLKPWIKVKKRVALEKRSFPPWEVWLQNSSSIWISVSYLPIKQDWQCLSSHKILWEIIVTLLTKWKSLPTQECHLCLHAPYIALMPGGCIPQQHFYQKTNPPLMTAMSSGKIHQPNSLSSWKELGNILNSEPVQQPVPTDMSQRQRRKISN